MANKKLVSVLSTAALTALISSAVATTAFAKIDGIVAKDAEGNYLNYDYEALKESLKNDVLGKDGAELYNAFKTGDVVSFHDDKVGFVDAEVVKNAAKDAALAKESFDVNAFTESAKETVLPGTVFAAKVEGGKVVKGTEVKPTSKPVETALAVETVSAINAKQVEIVFNREVDKTVAENVDNYDVFLAANLAADVFTTTAAGANASLQADGKTVILTLNTASNFVNYSTTNKVVVKKAVGLTADVTNAAIALSDTAVPTLLSAAATGANEITLTFSEPVQGVPANVVLNDGTVGINLLGAQYSVSGRTMKINTYANLLAGTAYTVKIKAANNITDYAGYGVAPSTASFTYSPVTVAPTYTLKSSNETSATIEFSSTIVANTLVGNAAVLVTHTYNNATNQVTGTAITNPSGDGKTFVISFAGVNALPPGASTIYMSYATGTLDAAKVRDAFGNIVNLTNLTVNTVADVTAPTATVELAANSNTVIHVTYSEAVNGATVAGNYTLKKGTTVVPFTGPTLVSGNKYALAATAPLSGDYTLEIKDIKDTSIAQNKFVTNTFNVSVADLIKPFVVNEAGVAGSNYYTQSDNKNVRIYFSEAMDLATLSDLTKYQNAADSFANPTSATPSADGKSVLLVFANATGGNIVVGTLKDQAGNLLQGLGATLTSVAGSNVGLITPTIAIPDEAIAESTTTVKVYLNDLIQNVTTSDFQVSKDGGVTWIYPATFTIDNTSGKSVITLILATTDAFDAGVTGVQVRTANAGVAGATANARNPYGKAIQFAAETVVDKIAPTVDRVVYVSATKIQVFFKENLNASTIAAAGLNGFSVSGGTLTSAIKGTANNVIELTGINFTADTDVIYNGANISDPTGNKLGAINHTAALTAGTTTIVNAVADNTFEVASNFETAALAVGDVDMDLATTGVQNKVTINGLDYTVTEVGGIVTITVSDDVAADGGALATAAATTATFTITRNTNVKTVTFSIPATTAGAIPAQPTVAAQ